MIGRLRRRGALLGVLAVVLTLTACDANPTGVPYVGLGRELAGVYNATTPAANLDMRLVLGTRHNLTGRYDDGVGGLIRFQGAWEQRGNKVFVTLAAQPGLPPVLELDVTRETILTRIIPGPFSMAPENAPPLFVEQDIMRLRGVAVIGGVQLQLDLARVITDVVGGGGGGQTQS